LNNLSLDRYDLRAFDYVAHEAGWIPVGCGGLRYTITVDAADHQQVLAHWAQRDPCVPLTKAVFAMVGTEIRQVPACARINRNVHARDARVATECDAADEGRRAGMHRGAIGKIRGPVENRVWI
jgi:hypothetical protein